MSLGFEQGMVVWEIFGDCPMTAANLDYRNGLCIEMNLEISLKLESMPTLCRSAFLPADTTITRRVAATIKVASSVVHWKDYCFQGIKNNNILPGPQQLTREPL